MKKSDPEVNLMVGTRLKNLRVVRGVTRKELAAAANITVQHLYNIENGKRGLSLENAIAFASALNTTADYLLGKALFNTETKEDLFDLMIDESKRTILHYIELCGYHERGYILHQEDGTILAETRKNIVKRTQQGELGDAYIDYYIFEHDSGFKVISRDDLLDLMMDVDGFVEYKMKRIAALPSLQPGYESYAHDGYYLGEKQTLDSEKILKLFEDNAKE